MQDQLHHPSTDGPPTVDHDAVLEALGRVFRDAAAADAEQTMAGPDWQATLDLIRAGVPDGAITGERTFQVPAQPAAGNR
jgi:hypothetical protein